MALIRCPLCGKEINDDTKKCDHCGYEFEKAFAERVIDPNSMILHMLQKDNEKIEEKTEEKIERQSVDVPEPCEIHDMASDLEDEIIEEKRFDSTGQARKDAIEYCIAAVLFGVALYVFIHYMVEDPLGNMFNFTGMGVLGSIGLVAAILSMGFEGTFPVSIKALLGCSIFLVLTIEFPIFAPVLLLLYGLCVYGLFVGYGGRLPGVTLGMVAVLCLPFWGVILFVLIEMLFSGSSRGSRSSRKRK